MLRQADSSEWNGRGDGKSRDQGHAGPGKCRSSRGRRSSTEAARAPNKQEHRSDTEQAQIC
jgi:hypothetical protein